jgi:hypothetical protein
LSVAVGKRVVFDDLDADQAGLAADRAECTAHVVGAQAVVFGDGDAGRIAGVERIDVEGQAESALGRADDFERVGEHGVEAAPFDFFHRKNADAKRFDQSSFTGLEAPHAHQADMLRRKRGVFAAQFGRAVTQQSGERHAVDIAGLARFERVRVHMRVDPQEADRAAPGFFRSGADAAPSADRAGVVTA